MGKWVKYPDATTLHCLIKDYSLGASTGQKAEDCFKGIRNFLEAFRPSADGESAKDPRFILERSDALNESQLGDALHLPFEKVEGVEVPLWLRQRKARELFYLLRDFCRSIVEDSPVAGETPPAGKIAWDEYATLLATPTRKNHTLVHDAISTRSLEIYKEVTGEFQSLREKQLPNGARALDDTTYANQFVLINDKHFSGVHDAVLTGNKPLYDAVVSDLDRLRKARLITDAQYAEQFTSRTPFCYLLIDAVRSGNEIFSDVLKRLKALYDEGHITKEQFLTQFISPSGKNHSLLHASVLPRQKERYDAAMRALKELRDGHLIDDAELARQLTSVSQYGHTLLHDVVFSKKKDLYDTVMADMHELRNQKGADGKPLIDDDAMARQFSAVPENHIGIIHTLAECAAPDLFAAAREDIKKYMPNRDLQTLLLLDDNRGRFNVYHAATKPETARPEIIRGLHQLFTHAFGEAQGQKRIFHLYQQKNARGYEAGRSTNPHIQDALGEIRPAENQGRGR